MERVELHRPMMEPESIDGSLDQKRSSNRRIHERLKAGTLEWLRGANVKYGAEVRVVDISAGGLLLETRQALKPNSNVVLELTGPDSPILIPSTVVRCRVASLGKFLTYQGACEFKRPLTLPELTVKLASKLTQSAMPITADETPTGEWRKVIARFNDGNAVCGYTNNFHPSQTQLHLLTDLRDGESTIVPLSEVEALFVLRDFAGDSTWVEAKFSSEHLMASR